MLQHMESTTNPNYFLQPHRGEFLMIPALFFYVLIHIYISAGPSVSNTHRILGNKRLHSTLCFHICLILHCGSTSKLKADTDILLQRQKDHSTHTSVDQNDLIEYHTDSLMSTHLTSFILGLSG